MCQGNNDVKAKKICSTFTMVLFARLRDMCVLSSIKANNVAKEKRIKKKIISLEWWNWKHAWEYNQLLNIISRNRELLWRTLANIFFWRFNDMMVGLLHAMCYAPQYCANNTEDCTSAEYRLLLLLHNCFGNVRKWTHI